MQKLSYQKLQPFKSSQNKHKQTNQQRFWKKYQNNLLQTYTSTVTSISSNRNPNQLMIYAQGRTLSIYDTLKAELLKQINLLANITSLCLRPDAAVMAIADYNGTIQLMDTKQKFHLRTFKNHKKRVNALEYVQNDLYSGGDDFILRHFDVAMGEVVHSYDHAHSDYIKSIKSLEDNHILSAGYDGYVRLFDFRFHHEEPVEAIDLFAGKLTFVSCGGPKVCLWDIRSTKHLFSACNNKKAVTGVHVMNEGSRFMTTSLDRYFKVYKSDNFQLSYQDKLPSAIHCFDLTQNNQHIFLALEAGQLISKSRHSKTDIETDDEEEAEVENQIFKWINNNQQKQFAYNNQYFYRGIYEKSQTFDIKFQQHQNKKLSQYDSFLKKFQYKEALMTSLDKKNMMIFLSLVDQFIQRGCLQRTLASLTQDQTSTLVTQLTPLIHNSKYSRTALLLLQKLLTISNEPASWKPKLIEHIDRQLTTINSLSQLDGMLQLLQNNFY